MKNSLEGILIIIAVTSVLALAMAASPAERVRLSESSFSYATELVDQGRVSVDLKDAWGESQPSAEDENDFIRAHGIEEYAKWHLGIDESHGPNAKARYKFPYGDFKTIHRSALLAVKSRARQHGYVDIENAANRLLERIETKRKDHEAPGGAGEEPSSHAAKKASISSGNSSL